MARNIGLHHQRSTHPQDIAALIERGIPAEGSRVELAKKIAWHYIFVRGMSEEEAAKEIITWVYRTGKKNSKDVRADLRRARRRWPSRPAE